LTVGYLLMALNRALICLHWASGTSLLPFCSCHHGKHVLEQVQGADALAGVLRHQTRCCTQLRLQTLGFPCCVHLCVPLCTCVRSLVYPSYLMVKILLQAGIDGLLDVARKTFIQVENTASKHCCLGSAIVMCITGVVIKRLFHLIPTLPHCHSTDHRRDRGLVRRIPYSIWYPQSQGDTSALACAVIVHSLWYCSSF
jgi:hypothetical protein